MKEEEEEEEPSRSSSEEEEEEEEEGRLKGGGLSPAPVKEAEEGTEAERRASWARAAAQPFFSFRNDVSMLLTMLY